MAILEPGEVPSFGGWVERRRRALNLTRAELAEKVGCAAVTIKKIERDERKPSRQMAEILAEHLGIARVDREDFMRMARTAYGDSTGSTDDSFHIPVFLQPDNPNPYSSKMVFVERHRELAHLEASLQQALAGNGLPVFLLGEAGSGKTALMREFARLASAAHPDLLVAGGQCNALTGPGDPFRPFRDILGILTGDLEIDWTIGMLNREQALQIWASIPGVIRAMTMVGPHLFDILLPLDPLVHRLAPYLGAQADWFDRLQAPGSAAPPARPDLQQGQVLEELAQVFRTVAAQHPLLLVLDDLQWADDASLNFLFHLGRRLRGSRILLLGSYRSDENDPGQPTTQADADQTHTPGNLILELTRQYGDIQVRLDQPSPAEARAFVDAIVDLEPNRLEEAFRKDLYLQTRGHPLFTVEILHSLRQNRNILLDEAGYWVENKSHSPTPPPARVEAIMEQRLRRLNPDQRELLNAASVAGEGFTAEIVANVLGLDLAATLKSFTHDLEQQQHLIQEQGQLHVRSLSLNRFQFRHLLIQDYLYNQLAAAEKRRLHAWMAEELEKNLFEPEDIPGSTPGSRQKIGQVLGVETLDTFGPALLRHFWLGQEWARAAAYAQQLGIRARQRYAMREAIAYYEQALESLGNQPGTPDEMIFDVLLGWQEAAFNFRPYQEQLSQLTRAEQIARNLQDKTRLIQALHWTANVLLARGFWSQAGPVLAESLSLAEELGNEQLSVRPTFFKALMTSFANPAEAVQWISRAEDLSRKHNDLQIEAIALGTEGQVLAQLGEFNRSRQAIENARQVSDRLGSPLTDSDVDLFAALASLAMGSLEQALEFAQRSVKTAIATDNMDCICTGMVCIGYSNLELGRVSEAASAFEKGIERSTISGAVIPRLNGQAGLAMTRFLGGHPEAVQDLEKLVNNMRLYENHVGAANANLMLGTCLLQLGELERASDPLTQAVDFYRQARMLPSLARALQSKAVLMDGQGQPDEAEKYRQEAESLRSSLSLPKEEKV